MFQLFKPDEDALEDLSMALWSGRVKASPEIAYDLNAALSFMPRRKLLLRIGNAKPGLATMGDCTWFESFWIAAALWWAQKQKQQKGVAVCSKSRILLLANNKLETGNDIFPAGTKMVLSRSLIE